MLSDIGILEPYGNGVGEDGLRLTELGRLFEDETLALFFSPAVKRALRRGRPNANYHRRSILAD